MDKLPEALLMQNNTAFYVFDIKELKKRVKHIRESLPKNVSLCYAIKANTFIINEISKEVDRFEICSPGESKICNTLHLPSEKMVISGVYKSADMVEELISDTTFNGIITVESLNQYELISRLSDKYGRTVPVLIRLTNGSQFGMNREDIEEIVTNRINFPNINILGIQFFSGTQKTSLKKLKREIEYLDAFLQDLEKNYGFKAEELEYGTGFPVSYFESDEFDEQELFNGFSKLIDNMETNAKITLELGRCIAASCGQYYTHIVDIKKNKEQNYVLINGGMHQMTYYGQQMAIKQPYFHVCGKEQEQKVGTWNICGSLCTMNDIVVKQAALPEIKIGDILCFKNTGAYCVTEGIALFLSRDLPAVYIIREDGKIVQARKSYETSQLNTPIY